MLYKILLAGLIGTCLSIYFKEHKNSAGFAILIAASLVIVFITLNYFTSVMASLKQIVDDFEGQSQYLVMLFKMLGITYVCDLTAGICRDSGNTAIAQQMQMFGKMLVFSLSLPIISTLFEIITSLI